MGVLNRVVITGLGSVTPIGIGNENYAKALKKGVSGANEITKFDASDLDVRIACEVKNFEAEKYMDSKKARRLDLVTKYALVAAQEAVKDSGLNFDNVNRDRVGVILGTGIGGFGTTHDQQRVLDNKGPRRVSPLTIPMLMPNAPACNISIRHGLYGNSKTVNSACSSFSDAIIDSYDKLRLGLADVIISGGSE
jgi:3-oxoacyl-[acyl-carrier-protein] synthase II